RGPNSLNLSFRSYPKERSGPHALLLGQNPQGSATVPSPVGDGLDVVGVVNLFSRGVVEAVGHNTVMLRVEAGDDGVVVGRRLGGKGWNHSFGCAGTLGSQSEQMVGVIALRVVVTEAVKRNEDDIWF